MCYKLTVTLVICLSSLFVYGDNREGQPEFANRKLKQLSELLPMRSFPDKDTIVEVPEVIKGKSLVFAVNAEKAISHIGVSLFSDETKQLVDVSICNFLERYMLELLLQQDVEAVKRKLAEYHIVLSMNGQEFDKGSFRSVSKVLQIMNMPVNFALKHIGKQAEAVWTFGSYNLYLSFPLYRELIDGTDKKESDEELYHLLQVAVFNPVQVADDKVSRENLRQVSGPVYVSKGEAFIISPLTSDRYYMEEEGAFVPLYHLQYPEYSMNNLFLTYLNGKDKTLLITHRKYGHFTPAVSIPLLSFLALFKEDFITTCHTGYNKKGELETIAVFSHKTLNYIHLLRVCAGKDKLFSKHPVLEADFYSNIPQHYIKSLLQ